jgi:hypothetical protein
LRNGQPIEANSMEAEVKATIKTVFCVRSATGTDTALNLALVNALRGLEPALPASSLVLGLRPTLEGLANVVAAVDTSRSDPDDLYITLGTVGDRGQAIWPGPGTCTEVQSAQSFDMNQSYEFADSMNLSLWDYDDVSDDDLLGSITIYAGESGQGDQTKLAKSEIEGSAYYVTYRVD